jgi:hypothetical protein
LRVKQKGDVSRGTLLKVALSLLDACQEWPVASFNTVAKVAFEKFGLTNRTTLSRALNLLESKQMLKRKTQGPGKPTVLAPNQELIWKQLVLPENPSRQQLNAWKPPTPGVTFPMKSQQGWQRVRITRIPDAPYTIDGGRRVLPAESDLSKQTFEEAQKNKRDLRTAIGEGRAYQFTQTMLGILFRNGRLAKRDITGE